MVYAEPPDPDLCHYNSHLPSIDNSVTNEASALKNMLVVFDTSSHLATCVLLDIRKKQKIKKIRLEIYRSFN